MASTVDQFQLEMPDGRSFEGSAVAIVSQMRALAFDREPSLDSYIRWSAETARVHLGVELSTEGESLEALAENFLASVVRAGLARKTD